MSDVSQNSRAGHKGLFLLTFVSISELICVILWKFFMVNPDFYTTNHYFLVLHHYLCSAFPCLVFLV